jgi:hypothetical protein
MQFFNRYLRIDRLRCPVIGMFIRLDGTEKLALTVAGKPIRLLINTDSAAAKINDPAKLGKKKNKQGCYRNIFFKHDAI